MEEQKIADWIEKTPFGPDEEKKPIKISKNMYPCFLYGSGSKCVNNEVFCSTDKITVGSYVLAPCNHYEPPGLHLYGDESYYILEGEAVGFNPESGETFSLKQGDTLLIPQKTRHQLFNFKNQKVTVIFTVAPRIWVEDAMGTIIPDVLKPRFYGSGFKASDKPIEAAKKINYVPSIDSIGFWPIEGKHLRKLKQLTVIKEDDQLPLIHGENSHILYSFIVSNDYMNIGIVSVPTNTTSEAENHKGDKLLHAIEGQLCVRVIEENENLDNNTIDAFNIYKGQSMLIPQGYSHQIINFGNEMGKAFFAIGPQV